MTAALTSPAERTATDAPVRPAVLVVTTLVVGVVAMALFLWAGDGRPVPSPAGLPDAGLATQWALPVVRVLADLAEILTVGLLLIGAVLVPSRGGVLRGAGRRWTRAARWSALVWAGAALAQVVLSLSDILAEPMTAALRPDVLWTFVRDVELGRALVAQAALALAVAVGAAIIRTATGAAVVGLVAVAGLVPPTLTSHVGTSADHRLAVGVLLVHVVAVSLWCGGIAAIVLLGAADRTQFPVAVPRFSLLALWCAVSVATSGAASAWVRLGDVASLATTSYGRLVVVKLILIIVLSGFGLWHRRRSMPQLADDVGRVLFLRVAALEVLVMAATVGVAVALARTPPPRMGSVPMQTMAPPAVVSPTTDAHQ